jgi:hypothetical protein
VYDDGGRARDQVNLLLINPHAVCERGLGAKKSDLGEMLESTAVEQLDSRLGARASFRDMGVQAKPILLREFNSQFQHRVRAPRCA